MFNLIIRLRLFQWSASELAVLAKYTSTLNYCIYISLVVTSPPKERDYHRMDIAFDQYWSVSIKIAK